MVDVKKLLENQNLKEYTLKSSSEGFEISTDGSLEDHHRAVEAMAAVAAMYLPNKAALLQEAQKRPVAGEYTLKQCVEDYMLERVGEFKDGTVKTYESAFNKLLKALGSTTKIQDITSEKFVAYRKKLDATLHPDSVHRDCGAWRGMFDWAIRRDRYTLKNPIENAAFSKSQRARLVSLREIPHRFFSKSDLDMIFDVGRYAKIKKPCAFWLPLLALYSGARLNELSSLKISSLSDETIKIDDSKTVAGIREIPIHPALIDFGLLRYIDDVKRNYGGDAMLFPHLTKSVKNGFGNKPGQDFGKMKTALGFCSDKVFHSFRITFVSCLQFNRVSDDIRKSFVGHEADDKKDAHTGYSQAKFSPADLAKEVFPLLNFENWLEFKMPTFEYKSGQFDKYFEKSKRTKLKNKLRAERNEHSKSKKQP